MKQRMNNTNRHNFESTTINWTLMGLMFLQQMSTIDGVKFKGDSCVTKNEPGICKEWDECPIIKTLIDNKSYTNREVVSCGFGIREELICCPVVRTDATTPKNDDRFVSSTSEDPARDFWMDLLQNTSTTTTTTTAEAPVRDFWTDLLSTTTVKPLTVSDQRLNESSEYFDFNAILIGNNRGQQRPEGQSREKSQALKQNSNPSNEGFMGANVNDRGNTNTGPINQNPWNFAQSGNNFRGNGRNHMNTPQNFGSFSNFGVRPNNGRVPQNNGRGRSNSNNGFLFPTNSMGGRVVFSNKNPSPVRPGMPVNIMQEQDPKIVVATRPNNNNKGNKLDELIKDIFEPTDEEKQASTSPLDESIANIFNVNKQQAPSSKAFRPAVPSSHTNNNRPSNPNVEFEIIPAIQNNNDLNAAPSTNFIKQPVVIETWPGNTQHNNGFNPIVNSGMDIIKAQPEEVERVFQKPSMQFVQQPQQFGRTPPQVVVVQHPWESSQLATQSESAAKESRSTSSLQQFLPATNDGSSPNIQSPPTNILDPFKPFEFRPAPDDQNAFVDGSNALSPNPSTNNSTNDRSAVRACRRIEGGLNASLSPHILGGIPAELGEFPHMAAIGYSRIGGDGMPPYDIRCGGTLIDKRYVLTAAHCVSDRENVPSIVRLGVVDFKDENQMRNAVELRIKETFIHDDYSTRLTYNDIAILELERDVEYSQFIYPVCLYTDEKDPPTNIKLWVTGWGTINTTTRSFSDILLKAPLHTSPLENCNKSFTDYGLNRRIPEGIIRSQFCAEDKDQLKDACQGDSGGPLNLIVDESLYNYRLVGVVSSGFGCASSTPGLYTRVAAFLDFIERIVWPNGGD